VIDWNREGITPAVAFELQDGGLQKGPVEFARHGRVERQQSSGHFEQEQTAEEEELEPEPEYLDERYPGEAFQEGGRSQGALVADQELVMGMA